MNAKRSTRREATQLTAQHSARTRHMHDVHAQHVTAEHYSAHNTVHKLHKMCTVSTASCCVHSRAIFPRVSSRRLTVFVCCAFQISTITTWTPSGREWVTIGSKHGVHLILKITIQCARGRQYHIKNTQYHTCNSFYIPAYTCQQCSVLGTAPVRL